MCDAVADDIPPPPVGTAHKKNALNADTVCMKCQLHKAAVVIRVHDPLCTTCFITYVTHKFRSTLGKSKLVQANDRVLLAVSGGHSSTALLHLVRDALSEGAHKRLKFSPAVVCIDESGTLPISLTQDYSHIKELAEEFGYPYHCLALERGFVGNLESGENDTETSSARNRFRTCFESIASLTAQLDFLMAQRVSVIAAFAQEHNYGKVMFGDTATSLCMKILGNITLGRGGMIPLDVGVSDKRFAGVTIIRPMRELSSKEVTMFNRMHGISVRQPINISTFKRSDSSLQKKTEELILGLQANFPHTVNTVFRTADKVCTVDQVDTSTGSKCCFCHSLLLNVTDTEREQDNNQTCGGGEGGCCGTGDECTTKQFVLTVDEMKSQLCYACKLTFKDMGYNLNSFPVGTVESATDAIKRQKMKVSIQDFLLE